MSAIQEEVRLLVKYSTITGEQPTIPQSDDHTDGTWLPTDIYIGEFFFNIVDNLLWLRSDTGIVPIGATGGTFSFIGDFVPTSGGTYSGLVKAPTFSSNYLYSTTIASNEISATQVVADYFFGDGSNLTNISAVWTGGTISNPVYFTNEVELTNDTYIDGLVKSNNTTIEVQPNLKVDGYITASVFYGDGSGLTNLPTGTYSDTYTIGATLSGTEVVFTRNDSSTYRVDLEPILATAGVADAYFVSADNKLVIELNDGTLVEAPINSFGNISADIFTANTIYANEFIGYLQGTVSGDIYTLEATFSLADREATFLRTDGSSYSLDLSELYDENKDTFRFITEPTDINKSFQVIANDLFVLDDLNIEAGDTEYSVGSQSFYDDALLQVDTIWLDGTLNVNGILVNGGGAGGAGQAGSSGTSGQNGTSGTSGNEGTSGTSGQNGSSGTSGEAGSSGSSGTSGVSGGAGSFTQSLLIPSRTAVWRADVSGTDTAGWWSSGGVYTDYPAAGISVVANTMYANTFVLEDGEKLEAFRFGFSGFSTATVVELAIMSITVSTVFQGSATYSGVRVGTKLKDCGTFSITSSSDLQVNNINFTGNKNSTFFNTYVLVWRPNGTGHSLRSGGTMVPDIGGGYTNGALYYRAFIQNLGTASSIPNDVGGRSIMNNTSPGWRFDYRKKYA